MTSKFIIIGIAFLLMVITGVVLSRLGHPLNKTLFAFHKIFTLLFIGLLVWLALPVLQVEPAGSNLLKAAIISGCLIVLAFISGALLSFEKVMPPFVTNIHRVLSLLVVLSTLTTGWLMLVK
jgi:hypothetical protein